MLALTKRRTRRFLVNLALLTLSIFLALGLVEILLRAFDVDFSAESGLDQLAPDERIGWVNEANQEHQVCNRQLRPDCITVRTNNQALREDADSSFALLPGVSRILVLGDSQTAADFVDNSETYASVLENRLNQELGGNAYEVLNAGVRGYSPVQEWLWYREIGTRYQPDVTVMGVYVGNDLLDVGPSDSRPYLEILSSAEPTLRNYPVTVREPSNQGVLEALKSDGPIEAIKEFLRPSYIYQTIRHVANNTALATPLREVGLVGSGQRGTVSTEDEKWRAAVRVCDGCVMQSLAQTYFLPNERISEYYLVVGEVFRRLKEEIASSNSRLIILLIPTKLTVEREQEEDLAEAADRLDIDLDSAAASDRQIYEDLLALCHQLEIEVIDLLAHFTQYRQQEASEPIFYNHNWHLSPAGHRVVAESIHGYLMETPSPRQ